MPKTTLAGKESINLKLDADVYNLIEIYAYNPLYKYKREYGLLSTIVTKALRHYFKSFQTQASEAKMHKDSLEELTRKYESLPAPQDMYADSARSRAR